jgi:hypothetical protein
MALLLLVSLFPAAAALRGEEADRWYLIAEAELRSIEQYREQSETERLDWLSQAHVLRIQAETSKQEADGLRKLSADLRTESASLNAQLAREREANRTLEQSFNEYEAGQSALISSRNGEIAELQAELAARTLESEQHKSTGRQRLIIIAVLAGAWVLFIALKICRAVKLFA